MNSQLLFRWIPIVCILILVIAGIGLKQKNKSLANHNTVLVLQNDSILSVNLRLSKEVSKLQHIVDSINIQNSSARINN
jgi:hypothetical protein